MVLTGWGAASGWLLSQSSRLRLFPSGVKATGPPWDPSALQDPAWQPCLQVLASQHSASHQLLSTRARQEERQLWPLASTSCIALNALF